MNNPEIENKMGTMPVGRLLLTMSAPTVASMLFLAFYNVIDSIFVAKLNQDALNAVSLAFPISTFVMAFTIGISVGMNSLLSKALGEKDAEKADRATNTGIFLFACTSVLFLILGLLAGRPYYRLLTDNEQIIRYGTDYVKICIGCSFAVCLEVSGERLLQSTGRTDLAMIAQICGEVANIILDPVLIFGLLGFPRLEVKGAAIATIIGEVLAGIIAYAMNITKNKEIHILPKKIRFHAETAGEIIRTGLPTAVIQAIGSFMNFALNSILIGFTEAATAAFGVYFKVQSFLFMPLYGMNTSLISIIAYNTGAKKYERVKQVIRLGIVISVSIMTAGTLVFELIPGTLIRLFSPTDRMLQVAKAAFRIIGISFPFAGFITIAGSACQALGKPQYTLLSSLCAQLIVLLPAARLLSLTGVLEYVWMAFPMAELVAFGMSAVFLNKVIRPLDAGERHE